jgi:hypothetical protein
MSDLMKPLYVLKMLHAVHYRLGINGFLELGLEYYQIAKLISELLQKEFVINTEDGLRLTDMGLQQLAELNKQLNPINQQAWILPSDENRIPRIDKFDIYLSKKKKPVE